MTSFFREPLLHFFLIGCAVFGLFAVFDDAPPPVAANELVVTEADARRLANEFEAVWRRAPSARELEGLIDQHVREEVYVREALALGLDRNDAVIRRRLQTKMEFITESGAEAVQPDEATLQGHLEDNVEKFAMPALLAFEQVLLNDALDESDLRAAKAILVRGGYPEEYLQASLIPQAFPLSPRRVVDGSFGAGMFDRLYALPPGEWSGPVETPFGRHLVRATEKREGKLPPLTEIRDRVEQDWRAAFSTTLREARYRALLSRYEVERPNAAEVLAR